MKTIVTSIASLAVLTTMSVSSLSPAHADTIREVRCPNGKVVTASGTQSEKQACQKFVFAPAAAGTQTQSAQKVFKAPGHKPVAKKFDNTAYAWTAACYREFGPNAKWPDAHLLDKCLSF